MKKGSRKRAFEVVILFIGLAGWVILADIFWLVLLNPNSNGYFLNFNKYGEFWFEFILIHIFIVLIVYGIIIFCKRILNELL